MVKKFICDQANGYAALKSMISNKVMLPPELSSPIGRIVSRTTHFRELIHNICHQLSEIPMNCVIVKGLPVENGKRHDESITPIISGRLQMAVAPTSFLTIRDIDRDYL